MVDVGYLIGYSDFECPNCGRLRVEEFSNGIHICEKCGWCVETESYCVEDLEHGCSGEDDSLDPEFWNWEVIDIGN